MSRCFPYPPPGYSGKRACNEALIESIKLQREREREREKAEAERKKEKKREKKEKKREKKEKSKPKPIEVGHDEKAHKVKKTWADLKEEYNNKRKDYEAEQLERSGLTEEHGHPIGSQNPSYSSDSTQNSNKRKRHPSFTNDSSSNATGSILRIRLPFQKHKEPDGSASSASKEQLCSTSGRTDLPSQHNKEVVPPRTDNLVQGLPPRPDKELSCSTSGKTEIFVQEKARIAPGSTSFERKMQKLNSVYKGLIEKWSPPVLQSEPNFDDQEWLFGREHQDGHGEKRFRSSSSDISSCGSSTLWPPRAQYLPEADIYALPYTLYF